MANQDSMSQYDDNTWTGPEVLGTGVAATGAAAAAIKYDDIANKVSDIKKSRNEQNMLARKEANKWLVSDEILNKLKSDAHDALVRRNTAVGADGGKSVKDADSELKKAKKDLREAKRFAIKRPGVTSSNVGSQPEVKAASDKLKSANKSKSDAVEYEKAEAAHTKAKDEYDLSSEHRKLKDEYAANPDKDASKMKKDFMKKSSFMKTKAGKRMTRNQADAKRQRDKGYVELNPKKTKFPAKKLGGLTAASAALYAGGGAASDAIGDWADDGAKSSREYRDSQEDGSIIGSIGNIAGEVLSNGMDYASLFPGALTGTAAAGVAAKYATDDIKKRYNLTNDPDGMSRTQAVGQFGKDAVEATKDKYKDVKNKLGRAKSFTTSLGGLRDDQDAKDAKVAAQEQFDADQEARKNNRWKDSRYDEYERRNKGLEASGQAEMSAAEQEEAVKKDVADKKNTGTRQYIKDRLDEDVNYRKDELRKVQKEISDRSTRMAPDPTGSEAAYDAKLEKRVNKLKTEITDLKVERDVDLDKMYTDEDITNNKKFHKYTQESDTTKKNKGKNSSKFKTSARMQEAVKVWDKTAKAAKDAASATVEKAAPIVEEGIEKSKGILGKAKGFAADKINAARKKAGLSEAPTSAPDVDTPEAKKGLLRRGVGAAMNNKATRGVSKALSPGALWNMAGVANDWYNSDDKEQFLRDTGNSIVEGVKGTYKEYEDLIDAGKYGDAALKFGDEFLLQGLEQSGKALYNVGAMGSNALLGTDADILNMEGRGFMTPMYDGYNSDGTDPRYLEYSGYDTVQTPKVESDQKDRSQNPSPPSVEKTMLDKRMKADALNKLSDDQRKMAEASAQAKFGNYLNANDYAEQYGAVALNNSDSRYGNTPIYSNQAGNSFSDTPTGMFGSKYENTVDDKQAKSLRDRYIKIEKSARDKMRKASMPNWAQSAGIEYDDFVNMKPKERSEGLKSYNNAVANKKNTDRDFNLLIEQNLAAGGPEAEATKNYIRNGMTTGTATSASTQAFASNKAREEIDSGISIPFMNKSDPLTARPTVNAAGQVVSHDYNGVIFNDENISDDVAIAAQTRRLNQAGL